MKNIALIVPSLRGGGAERVVSNITMSLPKDKYKVYLILFDISSIEYPYSGELINIDIKASNNPFIKAINFVRRYFRIKEIKRKHKISVSLSFLGGPNLLNILTKNRDKVIVSVRAYVSKQHKSIYTWIEKYLIKKTYNKADIVVGVSRLISYDMKINYNIDEDKVRTIYNPYNLKEIDKLSKESIENEYRNLFQKKVVITVGRLTYSKGHWHLIRAFKKINDCKEDVILVILGEGELGGYLQSLVDNLGLNDKVYLLGFKNNPYKYIKKSSIFVLPSLSEGFPNALVEAMACGIPVIASDCKSGPREILAPKTDIEFQCTEKELGQYGILIPVCDGKNYTHNDQLTKEENIMADTIIELLNDQKTYVKYAEESKGRVEDFEIDQIIKEWENIID